MDHVEYFTAPNFGLGIDLNYKLLDFLDEDALSKLPLTDFQIDLLADRLNWDIMSSKELSGWIFIKHKDRINWNAFLQNGHPKDIDSLAEVKDKLYECYNLFLNPRIKKMYYTSKFISTFPEFIDWHWCIRNLKMPENMLLQHWSKFDKKRLCRFQHLSENLIRKKKDALYWIYICKKPLSENFIIEMEEYVNWEYIFKFQSLSNEFLMKNVSRCRTHKFIVARYQKPSEEFINKNKEWISFDLLSRYQDLSIDFIRQNWDLLSFENLQKNSNYNKPNTIQILKSQDRWYVIEAPIINLKFNRNDMLKSQEIYFSYDTTASTNLDACDDTDLIL